MCGLAICIGSGESPDTIAARLNSIEEVQTHRGPNSQDTEIFLFGDRVLGLGQQRLSILDLTPAGNQPMRSPCGRYVIVYNGEVYNYKELARELGSDPILDISSCDTAVVLAALARWGSAALSRFNGMWALAFLDRKEGRLLLARDRLGVKPLYFADVDGTRIFASEVKGVLAGALGRRFPINRDVVNRFLLQSLTSATDETFFRGIEAFPPGAFAEIDLSTKAGPLAFERFWRHPFEEGRPEAPVTPERVRELLFDSVRLRLRSDVPVGLMLSGGLDSSSLLAAARTVAPEADLKVLSVVSRNPEANEERFIDCMARHVGIETIKLQTDDDPVALWNDLGDAVWGYDHPVSSFSNLAHRRLMREAVANDMTVLLTGQGGDEQLGGYNKFFYFYVLDQMRRGKVAKPIEMVAGSVLNGTILRDFRLAHAKRYIPFLRDQGSRRWAGSGVNDAALLATGLGNSYAEREWKDMTSLSLPDLLTSEDRASMAFSREMRTPFLDYRLVETLACAPVEQKLKKGWTKHVLREAMTGYLPPEIAWRRDKRGYTVPGKAWMQERLRSEIEREFASPMVIEGYGLVDRKGANALFQDLQANRPGVRYEDILSLVSLERWVRRFAPYIEGIA